MSNGGFQNGVNVNGIGIDNAALIAWRTLLFYLGQYSNYNDARNGSINAATALFGECSNEVIQVRNAWAAVGVGAAANPNCIILDPSFIDVCYDDPHAWRTQFPITITANFGPASGTITWNVPPDFAYTISGNELIITSGPLAPDVFLPIQATVTSGVGGPVTATTWYSTYECYGDFIMKASKRNNEVPERTITPNNSIYPNPARNYINIHLQNRAVVKLSDITGRVLFKKDYNPGLNRLNTERFSNGIYILYIIENDKSTSYKIKIAH